MFIDIFHLGISTVNLEVFLEKVIDVICEIKFMLR